LISLLISISELLIVLLIETYGLSSGSLLIVSTLAEILGGDSNSALSLLVIVLKALYLSMPREAVLDGCYTERRNALLLRLSLGTRVGFFAAVDYIFDSCW
jgi:hypothetical protein